MKSITSLSAVMALAILLSKASAFVTTAPTLQGCFSSAGDLTYLNSYGYQSSGNCSNHCYNDLNQPVAALTAGTECYCGNSIPPSSAEVDASTYCNMPCTGYGLQNCGGDGYFSVYLDGLPLSASNSDTTSATTTSSQTTSTGTPSTTTSTKPSVVTIGGQTETVTASVSPTNSSSSSSSGGGPSKAGIAAGVVVGIAAAAAIAGGIYLFLRNRKRRQVEEEYRRNAAINSFVNQKPPTSSGGVSSFTDTRLDPAVMAQRRMSDGSIADNQDYSRRILKVTNA